MDVKLTALTVAILAGLTAPAFADRGGAGMGPGGFQAERPSFAALDTDGNGVLTAEELQAAGAVQFAATDTDGNGELSPEEMAAAATGHMQNRIETRTAHMIQRLDTDGNGSLSQSELSAKMKTPPAARILNRLDKNDDGTLSEEEYQAAAQWGPHGKKGDHKGQGFWK